MSQGLGMCASVVCVLVALASGVSQEAAAQEGGAVMLPTGVRAVWDLGKAHRESTVTRERVCINGLWRWQPFDPAHGPSPRFGTEVPSPVEGPADAVADTVPADGWGFFKVPGSWPGITDYMQKDSQTVYGHPRWAKRGSTGSPRPDSPRPVFDPEAQTRRELVEGRNLRDITAAWYQREVTVPAEWTGRRIAVYAEYLNSFATVYVDGTKAGEMRFPADEVDLTSVCRPGGTYVLSMHVEAMPLKAVMLSFGDTNAARQVKGTVARRGLCGDVYLVSTPARARITDVQVSTSVRKGEITFEAGLEGLSADGRYAFRAQVQESGRRVAEFAGPTFSGADVKGGRMAFTASWKPGKPFDRLTVPRSGSGKVPSPVEGLWDIHTPQNMYEVRLSLVASEGQVLDVALPQRFGFREFWIEGRDFYLNGTRIFLSAVPVDNAQVGAALANYEAVRESLLRLQSFGINFVYTHNYDCQPGSHLSFEEVLRAADDVGMLVALSQPHFGQYNWDMPEAEETNGYAQHAQFYTRVAGNHPSVVCYSTSHNATGYAEDMNPDMIDGLTDRSAWGGRDVARALRAEAIIKRLDPTRIVYHHSSGNLGSMHTINFYANWAPIQEMSDWFEHWATKGVKPLFTCEYGTPCTWDWTMYRGWYKGKRTFGSAVVPWEYCMAEWNAQFLGDEAYRISNAEKENLRWEARKFREGSLWHRWDYPHFVGSTDFDEQYPVLAAYTADNWRAFRTWGLSANSPWEFGSFWKVRPGVSRERQEFPTDWDNLQRPGLSPDYVQDRYERMDLAFQRADWVATPAAEALSRNNMPLLAYVAGKPAAFTNKDHNFLPGETVEKQLIVINNSRVTVKADCSWSLGLPHTLSGSRVVTLPTGEQERIPLTFKLPKDLAPGRYAISASAKFGTGETQEDAFSIDVLPTPRPVRAAGRTALFDPKGVSAALLGRLGVPFETVNADADLSGYDVLIVGKGALTLTEPAPDIARVREGLKVVVFEQTGEVLEKRFGFRVAEYGLRWVFARVPDHPLLTGLTEEHLRNWRGEATVLPPRLQYQGPTSTVQWSSIPVQRVWRVGNRGNVASALIEKPARGDFLPILDGGYALQYTTFAEYREGKGLVLFCQTDVSGRTESDPAADALTRNILRYVSNWKLGPRRTVVYAGERAGKERLEAAGFSPGPYTGRGLPRDQVLLAGPGGGRELTGNSAAIADWLKAGGHVLAIGLSGEEASAFLPSAVRTTQAEHIAAYFPPFGAGTLLAGVSPADVHNRDPRQLPLVSGGATTVGDGVLAKVEDANVVFLQLAPWQLDYSGEKMNVKRTFRKVSFAMTRLLANMGAAGQTPLLERFAKPVAEGEKRWLEGFYLDAPEEWDDPYRFFRW